MVLRGFHAADVVLSTGVVTVPGAYAAPAPIDFNYTVVPSSVKSVGIQHMLSAKRRAFSVTEFVDRTGATASATLRTPSVSKNPLVVTTGHPESGQLGQQIVYEWFAAPLAGPYNLNLGSVRLPEYESVPGYDVSTHVLTWTERSGGSAGNFVRARIGVFRDDIPEGRSWSWHIVGPRTNTQLQYPTLPLADFDFNPATGDIVTIRELTNASLPTGVFAAFHSRGFDDLLTLIDDTSGRLVQQNLYVPSEL